MTGADPGNNRSLEKKVTCPPWFCFAFDNPLRKLVQDPYKILQPYIKPGMTILDAGPGIGYFTIPLAVLAGENGKVIAADLQPAMLAGVKRRAVRAKVANRITLHQAAEEKIGVTEPVDFCLAFWMVHEVPDRTRFLGESVSLLKPGGLFFFAEPRVHVTEPSFKASLDILKGLGLSVVDEPKIFISRAAVLKKQPLAIGL